MAARAGMVTRKVSAMRTILNDRQQLQDLFFDPGSNKFIAELHQTTGTSFGTSEYRITGTVPEEVCRHNRLSVMVVANWMRYGNLIPGHNHIDDVINAEWAQFDILDKFELDPARGRLMPFYGFGTYDNVTFRKGEVTRLDEPVALLRAMAKVEVVLDMPAVDDVKVEICGYNAKGCCTPVFPNMTITITGIGTRTILGNCILQAERMTLMRQATGKNFKGLTTGQGSPSG